MIFDLIFEKSTSENREISDLPDMAPNHGWEGKMDDFSKKSDQNQNLSKGSGGATGVLRPFSWSIGTN